MQGTPATALLADRRCRAAVRSRHRHDPPVAALGQGCYHGDPRRECDPAAAADVKAAAGGQAAWPGAFRKLNALPPYGPQRRK